MVIHRIRRRLCRRYYDAYAVLTLRLLLWARRLEAGEDPRRIAEEMREWAAGVLRG
ncbi:hypothetical protein [Pyrodictium abyssi]|uniref:Uncharacterized protein n=1 Tax=Pyrodictium abyssi TaxID=54256 RepID=A0ABN6ZLY1_9CREN|nr:hypothetical protein PABY_08240 [Pyrodictium abyssi]